jgi:hypothetical protein
MSSDRAIALFQRLVLLWVLGFTLSALPSAERMWLSPVSPAWFPPSPLRHLTHALGGAVPEPIVALALAVLVGLVVWQLLAPARWWAWALLWWLHLNLMNRAWLAGSGGQQLMANALFWCIFLAMRPEPARLLGRWAIRLQLVLAYGATGLHKLLGAHWIDGTAMGIVVTDAAFGPDWIASHPMLAKLLTWLILAFQLSFPVAVWFRRLRVPWMVFGAFFHLGTALWMDIPEMGLAFLVCYAAWWGEPPSGVSGAIRVRRAGSELADR